MAWVAAGRHKAPCGLPGLLADSCTQPVPVGPARAAAHTDPPDPHRQTTRAQNMPPRGPGHAFPWQPQEPGPLDTRLEQPAGAPLQRLTREEGGSGRVLPLPSSRGRSPHLA